MCECVKGVRIRVRVGGINFPLSLSLSIVSLI